MRVKFNWAACWKGAHPCISLFSGILGLELGLSEPQPEIPSTGSGRQFWGGWATRGRGSATACSMIDPQSLWSARDWRRCQCASGGALHLLPGGDPRPDPG